MQGQRGEPLQTEQFVQFSAGLLNFLLSLEQTMGHKLGVTEHKLMRLDMPDPAHWECALV